MKKVFYLVAASLLMTSCLEDPIIEAYNEDFERVFGDTDPLHTWKMVDNRSVEVNLDKSSRVKIYVLVDDTYRLVADYENVSGTRTLSYDAPTGCEDIFVTVDGVPYQGVNSRTSEKPVVVSFKEYKEFSYETLENFHTAKSLPEKIDNRGKVKTTGCKFISKAEDSNANDGYSYYDFYPIYWGGEFKHTYGLYYIDENGEIERCDPFFTKQENGDGKNPLKYKDLKNIDGEWLPVTDNYLEKLFSFSQDGVDKSKSILSSPGFTIKVKHETVFGFYVKVTHNGNDVGTFYSDPELNDNSRLINPFAYWHVEGDENTYITVEDYTDYDYNDFIFMMSGTHTHFDDEPIKYIYAVEDLGGSNDFDFNDVVFSVSHVSGHENAIVQPLAAGGIFPAKICFKGEKNYESQEIHSMFGKDPKVMINTSSGTMNSYANPFLVKVGSDWSHAMYQNFSVKVEFSEDDVREVKTYEPNKNNSAPQMLILSEDWLWPTEKTSIADAYPKFYQWTTDYEQNTWVEEPVSGLVVNR